MKNTRVFCLLSAIMLLLVVAIGGPVHLFINCEAMAASVPDIKTALVFPMSGMFSRNGNLSVQGYKAAIGWVNDNGGIKSLGGARLLPVVADCGSSVEGAANAMERVCRDRDIVVACDGWASSFGLATTEIGERLGLVSFSLGLADALSARGFKWSFYPCAAYESLCAIGLPKVVELAKSAGKEIKTAMEVGNNQAASKAFYAQARKYFSNMGIKFVGSETWAVGTLTDATPIMQKVKMLNPDLVVYMGDALTEIQMVMMKKKELDIKTPFLCGGGWLGDPSLRFGGEYLDSWLAITPNFPHKLTPPEWIKRSLDQSRKEYSDEAWAGQELMLGWNSIPIIAEVLERAGSTEPNAMREAARKLDISNVMATRQTVGQGMAFDETGRVAEKYRGALIVQWQGGKPYTVYPPHLATAKPIWGAK